MFKQQKITVLFFTAALVIAGLFYADSAKAACTFSGPGIWGKHPAVIALNENILYSLSGNQECANKNAIVEVYGQGGFDFRINTIAIRAGSTGTVSPTISFRASDFSGRNGDQRVYVKVRAEDGSSNTVTSSDLTVKLSSGGSCTLTSAQWRWSFSDQPILGSPMDLVVNGSGCSNFGVNIEIKEQDVGLGDDSMGFVQATFNSQGTQAIGKWTVDGSKDDDNVGSYIFYFEAAAGNSRVTSNQLQIALRSQDGCLNCNAVLAPSTCECADGFSGPRSFAGTCDAVCKDHIGDAHGGPSGGGICNNDGKCDPGEIAGFCPKDNCKVAPGETTIIPFSLDNPIQATNLIELIDVIAGWLFAIAIPIAVAMIVYAGVIFLISRGDTTKVAQAKKILLYAVVGLAIILIGRGFITLIESILNLGTSP